MMNSPRGLTVVVVVVDVKRLCNAIAEFVETIEGVKVVGTANSIKEALECITNLEPAVVTLDINMPRFGLLQNGIDVLRWIKQNYPATKVLMLSIHKDPIYQNTCQALGAYAYFEKSAGDELAKVLARLVAEHADS